MPANVPLLSLKNVRKAFPGVLALDKVNFHVYAGKAMGLAGENGAGKSTLMKIITGIYQKDAGEIFYKSNAVQFNSIRDSLSAGIAMIHQELNLVPELSIMENIFLGREPQNRFGRIDFKKMQKDTELLLEKLGTQHHPRQKVRELSIGAQQLVEIAKTLSQNMRLIIMDEPTDALTPKETRNLFKIIRELKKDNRAIVYISHRLPEFFEICEDITVFRDGKFICENPVTSINQETLIEKMVGRKLTKQFPRATIPRRNIALQAEHVSNNFVHDVSFALYESEVLGISGLMGSGRSELCKTIAGAIPVKSGSLRVGSKRVKLKNVKYAHKHNIFYVSEDRKKDGLILTRNIRENISLPSLALFEELLFHINKKKEKAKTQSYIDKFQIKTPSSEQLLKNLSGGNQQKVAIAKGLLTAPKILILDEPTRGIDVGAKYDIYLLINELKKSGIAIILVSSDMPEVIGLSDKILVMSEGKIKGSFYAREVSQEKLLAAATKT